VVRSVKRLCKTVIDPLKCIGEQEQEAKQRPKLLVSGEEFAAGDQILGAARRMAELYFLAG